MRSTDIMTCPVNALTCHLVSIIDQQRHFSIPTIAKGRRSWYNAHLVFARKGIQNPIAYETMRSRFNRLFKIIGLASTKSTHICRGSGARYLEEFGYVRCIISKLVFLCICIELYQNFKLIFVVYSISGFPIPKFLGMVDG